MPKHFCFFILLLLFVATTVVAETFNPSSLIKVNAENNPKCVEYFNYKGELYCSTRPISVEPIDPTIKDYEKLKIVFDDRAWQAVWGKKTPTITTVEYVPNGDNIDNWFELVTSQFLPGVNITPKEYVDVTIQKMRESGLEPIVNFIEQSPTQVIFEFRILTPANLKQDELQIVTKKSDGLYLLHYVIKESDMGVERRNKWIQNLKNSMFSQ